MRASSWGRAAGEGGGVQLNLERCRWQQPQPAAATCIMQARLVYHLQGLAPAPGCEAALQGDVALRISSLAGKA